MASSGYGQDEWWLKKLRSGGRGGYARDVLHRGYCVVDGVVAAELVAACAREGAAQPESSLDGKLCAGGPLAARARCADLLAEQRVARPSAQPLAASRRLAEQLEQLLDEVRTACALAAGSRAGWGSAATLAAARGATGAVQRRCVLARGAGDGDRIRLRVAARGYGRDVSYICFVDAGSSGLELGALAGGPAAPPAPSRGSGARVAAAAGRVVIFVDALPLRVEPTTDASALVVAGWSATRGIVRVEPDRLPPPALPPSSAHRPSGRGGEQHKVADRRRKLRVTMLHALLRASQLKAVADRQQRSVAVGAAVEAEEAAGPALPVPQQQQEQPTPGSAPAVVTECAARPPAQR